MNDKINRCFSKVYEDHVWGGPDAIPGRRNQKYYSGGGTDPDNDYKNQYVNLLQSYVSKPDIKTVIEIGCGDWEVSSRIDWSGVSYKGYDVVPGLIEHNRSLYGASNIEFVCEDLIKANNARADLLIIKDVIQHLPTSHAIKFVKNIPNNFKYNLVTNDMGYQNNEIEFGSYQANNFNIAPFHMNYTLLIQWKQKFAEAGNKQTISLTR
jgi:2-polyprenyl-3-methyl-5-hydroxy-6-metoxy-1,4-benzoquinol methylase